MSDSRVTQLPHLSKEGTVRRHRRQGGRHIAAQLAVGVGQHAQYPCAADACQSICSDKLLLAAYTLTLREVDNCRSATQLTLHTGHQSPSRT